MPVTVTLVTNGSDYAPSLALNERSVEASRSYIIAGTGDLEVAANAPGLPRVGDAWGPGVDLYAASVRVRPIGGANCRAEVLYRSPDPAGDREPKPPRSPADSYTQLESGTTGINVLYAWNAIGNPNFGSPPDFGPINGGRGIPDDRGTLSARVVRYFTNPAEFDLARLVALASDGAVNDAALTLPPVAGLFPVTLAAGQAKYVGFEGPELAAAPPAAPVRLYKVVHRLALDFDHIARYTESDVSGGASIGRAVHLSPRRSFAGLW